MKENSVCGVCNLNEFCLFIMIDFDLFNNEMSDHEYIIISI